MRPVLTTLVACATSAAAMGSGCTRAEPLPNVVLIYVDDLGWRDIGVMGSEYYRTPHIDALADSGMLFTNAYANAPNCAPSRASLHTGLYGPRHGIYTVGSATRGDTRHRKLLPVDNVTALDTGFLTLAEALRAGGYVTGHVGKWHLGGTGSLPTDHGFDWAVAGDHRGSPPSHFHPYANATGQLRDLGASGEEGEYLTDRLTSEAIGFIRANHDRPFFLYLAHYAVHTPIQAKPELVGHYRALLASGGQDNPTYAAMVHSVDESVGRVLETIDELGLSRNTVVIFYSDNGGFGPVTSMAPLRGSKGMLYEGGIRVPLVIQWPAVIAAGSRSDHPVIGTDLFPTILELTGLKQPADLSLDGQSLVPVVTGGATGRERALFWHFPAYLEADRSVSGPWRTTPASAIRLGDYKLITFFEDRHVELYDLHHDIGERHDLAEEMPEKARELIDALESWWEQTEAWLPSTPNPEFDPDALSSAMR